MRKSERRQLQAVLTEHETIKTEVLTDLLDKAVSHALMETVYMRCNQLHQRIVMALNENIKRRKQDDRDAFQCTGIQ